MTDISCNVCIVCGKVLSNRHNLLKHVQGVHKISKNEDGTFRCLETGCDNHACTYYTQDDIQKHVAEFHKSKRTSSGPSTCGICNKTFKKKKSLYCHMRLVHKIRIQTGTLKCPVEDCKSMHITLARIRIHLAHAHHITNVMQKLEKTFPSVEDFMAWKNQEEKEKRSSFVLRQSPNPAGEMQRRIYYCHRSGNFQSSGMGKRRLKLQGSCKIGKICPAAMIAEFHPDGSIRVAYWGGHFGHGNNMAHIHLTDAERAEIAGKLAQGMPFSQVLDDIRNCVDGPLERIHLLSRKDLHNIVASFDLHSKKHHESDAVSVALWVEGLMELEKSPVIYYKAQGAVGGDHMTLSEEDFMLVVMTTEQQEMMRFGSDKICVNSIHRTNGCDFHLTTILIVDEFGAVFPVSFCISNTITDVHMHHFFAAVREKVGVITASVFMSDDDPAYYYAWKAEMGDAESHLLCTWHLDENWKRHIQEMVTGDKDAQDRVYKRVRALMETKAEKDLQNRVQTCINSLLSDYETREFGEYFRDAYAARVETWALCYRVKAGIPTAMRLASMHKELKNIYLDGKKVKRLDKCLSALMKLARDKIFERTIRLSKNTKALTVAEINKRHEESLDVSISDVMPVEEGWNVISQSNRNESYHIVRVEDYCHGKCEMTCDHCHVCIHMYTCTCLDALVHSTVCKHVHAVIRKIGQQDESQGVVAYTVEVGNYDDLDTLIRACNEAQKPADPKRSFERTLNRCLEFINSAHSVDDSEILQMDSLLEKWLTEMQNKPSGQPAEVRKEPPNKKIKLQRLAKRKENGPIIISLHHERQD